MTPFLATVATHLWQSTLFVGVAALLTRLLRANHARTRSLIWLTASVKFLVPFGVLVAIGRQFAWRGTDLPRPAIAAVEAVATPLANLSAPDFSASPIAIAAAASFRPTSMGIDVGALLLAIWLTGTLCLVSVWCVRWRRVQQMRHAARPVTGGRDLEILRRVAHAFSSRHVLLLASEGSLEPGVIGCLKPVILWPLQISQRLTDQQIEAILLHELAHVRRHDNLRALVHMSVQAIFWFHPLVWWIGGRLVDERELACDEEVVRRGVDPHQYAESILRTCEFAVESPLTCVAGVTGSDLKRRVVAIVSGRPRASLGRLKLALLTTIALLCAVGPIAAGALTHTVRLPGIPDVAGTSGMPGMIDKTVRVVAFNGRRFARSSDALRPDAADALESTTDRLAESEPESRLLIISAGARSGLLAAATRWAGIAAPAADIAATVPAQASQVATPSPAAAGASPRFEVASIKLIPRAGELQTMRVALGNATSNYYTTTSSVRVLIQQAYQIPFIQQLGGPDWIREDNYSINAKMPDGLERTPANLQAMLRALLADRFKLVVREDVQNLPIYSLVFARADQKLGPQLQLVTTDCTATPAAEDCRQQMQLLRGTLSMRNAPFDRLVSTLQSAAGRPIVDRTGLTGRYTVPGVNYAPDDMIAAGVSDLPSLFTAVQEQLGLKLESERGPVKVVIIESIERPTEN